MCRSDYPACFDCTGMPVDRKKFQREGRNDYMLRLWGTDCFPESDQYLRCDRSDAEYGDTAAVCELWTYIADYVIYGDRDCFKCWASAQKILIRGLKT